MIFASRVYDRRVSAAQVDRLFVDTDHNVPDSVSHDKPLSGNTSDADWIFGKNRERWERIERGNGGGSPMQLPWFLPARIVMTK